MGRHRDPVQTVDPAQLVDDVTLTPIPQQVMIKPAFEERYRHLLGERYDEFLQFSLSYSTKSIRVNTLKISVEELRKRLEKDWDLKPVPWCRKVSSSRTNM